MRNSSKIFILKDEQDKYGNLFKHEDLDLIVCLANYVNIIRPKQGLNLMNKQ